MAKILIVDDRWENRSLLRTLLAAEGHQVQEAGGAEEALVQAREGLPDLMVTDVLMPGGDGYELLRRLRLLPDGAGVKVVFWTAHYFSEEAQALARDYGVVAVMPKPLEAKRILDFVRAVLARPAQDALPPSPAADRRHLALVSDTLSRTVGTLEGSLGRLAEETAQRLATEALLNQRDQQLAQAQRLEAAGRLAAGVAHDFNNYLSVILAAVQLTQEDLGGPVGHLREIVQAAEKAAALCRQLMVMGRRYPLRPTRMDLSLVADAMRPVLQGLMKQDRELGMTLLPSGAWVTVDRAQLEQVLLNLVVNARDAVAPRGHIWVRVSAEDLGPEQLQALPGLKQSHCVRLDVRDNGVGIADADLPHIFEPYFTTKAEGSGTGLGLALVYGIVKEAGGVVTVRSDPGEGTCFTVRFPAAPSPAVEPDLGAQASLK